MIAGPAQLLLSALLHASWNALLKRERDPRWAVTGVVAAGLLFAAAAALLFPGAGFPTRAGLAWTVAAGLFEGLYFLTLAGALARASYGAVYAIARGGAMALVWPAAALLLAEPVTARGAGGAALVALGVVLVAWAGRQHASPGGLLLSAASAGAIAGYHLCYDRALVNGAARAPLFAVALLVALPLTWLAARLRGGGAAPGRGEVLRWLAAGALLTGSFLLFLGGLAESGAGPALTLRNTSVVFAQAIAAALGEPVPRRQLGGALLVVAGAALLAAG
ncbi:MAG: permease [Deltaproteobacteria bacterium]|nr:permease [Deltaproteobacteria bacterium]